MAKLTLTDLTSTYNSVTTLNANQDATEVAMENTLSRDGTSTNSMTADFDMNSNRILNLPAAVHEDDPVILSQAAIIAGVTNPLTRESVGAVLYPETAAETGASITVVNDYYPEGHLLRYTSNLGDGTTDNTVALEAMIAIPGFKYVPKPTSKWRTDQLVFSGLSDMHIHIEPGTVIEANSGYVSEEQLFDLVLSSRVSIDAPGGAIFRMLTADRVDEHGHIFRVLDCDNIWINGIWCQDAGGDGIAVGRSDTPATNVYVTNCIFDNSYRNACSVTSGTNIIFENCDFRNTAGTSPQKGVDVEPNPDDITPTEMGGSLDNIRFINCRSKDNTSSGFTVGLADLIQGTGTEVDVKFIGCVDYGSAVGFDMSGGLEANTGHVEFAGCSSYNAGGNGLAVSHSGSPVSWTGGYIVNCNQDVNADARFGSAISVYSTGNTDGREHGNLTVKGLKVRDPDGNMVKTVALQTITEPNSIIKNIDIEVDAAGVGNTARTSSSGGLREDPIRIVYTDRPVFSDPSGIGSTSTQQYANQTINNTGSTGPDTFNLTHTSSQWAGNTYDFEITVEEEYNISGGTGTEFFPGNQDSMRSNSLGSKLSIRWDEVAGNWQVTHQEGVWQILAPQFGASDGTPTVRGMTYAETSATAFTVTQLDDGLAGQRLTLVSKGITTFDTSTATRLIGSTGDVVTASGDVTEWICETGGTTASVWRLLGYVDVDVDNSAGA
jgi:hypothetical protein